MKPTSSLSLLLFLSLTTAAPILSKLPKDLCLHYTTCQPWLRETFSPSDNGHTPATRLSSPHFPPHHANEPASSPESHRQVEEEFNNAPLTALSHVKPDTALLVDRPLQSSYLLSLSRLPALQNPPQGEPEYPSMIEALPSKPTSSLPKLRKEDAMRYWATITSAEKKEEESGPARKCGSAFLRVGQPMIMAREYSDLLVVGIVVLFLAAVVVLEALEYLGDIRRQSRGEIFLEDQEAALIVKPFVSQRASTKFTTSLSPMREAEAEKDGLDRE